MITVTLNEASKVFKAHPRTILRAITRTPNPYWAEDFNPDIVVSELAQAYSCGNGLMKRLFEGRDFLLTPTEAARELEIPDRTFRYRKYPSVRNGGIVRYPRSSLLHRHYKKWDNE
jgi:hypothetical protein